MPIEIIKEQPFLLLIIIIFIIIYQLIDIVNYIGCWLMNLFSTWQRSHVVGHSSHRVTCGAEFLIVFGLFILKLSLSIHNLTYYYYYYYYYYYTEIKQSMSNMQNYLTNSWLMLRSLSTARSLLFNKLIYKSSQFQRLCI